MPEMGGLEFLRTPRGAIPASSRLPVGIITGDYFLGETVLQELGSPRRHRPLQAGPHGRPGALTDQLLGRDAVASPGRPIIALPERKPRRPRPRRPARPGRRAAGRRHGAVGRPHRRPRRAAGGDGLHRRRQGQPGRADPRDAGGARPEEEVRARNRARVPEALSAGRTSRSKRAPCRSCSAAITRSAAGSVGASADFAAAKRPGHRPALGRRARRHEHAGDHVERQRARHAARGAPRARAGRALADRRALAQSARRQDRPHRHPQPRRAGEGTRSATRRCTCSR